MVCVGWSQTEITKMGDRVLGYCHDARRREKLGDLKNLGCLFSNVNSAIL